MSYAQLFAQKLNKESKDGQGSTGSGQNDRKKDGDRRTDNRKDRKRERDDSRRNSRSEPDRKRPYDESKRPNSRARERNKSRYQGKIPEGWIGCPEHGELIHDFILPIKVPLHPNYDNHVKKYGKLWKMKDLFQLEQKFDKKVHFSLYYGCFLRQLIFRSVL